MGTIKLVIKRFFVCLGLIFFGVGIGFYLGSRPLFERGHGIPIKQASVSLNKTKKASTHQKSMIKKKRPSLFQVLSRGDQYLLELEEKGDVATRLDFDKLKFGDRIFKISEKKMDVIRKQIKEMSKKEIKKDEPDKGK